jgi:hypothetical protein
MKLDNPFNLPEWVRLQLPVMGFEGDDNKGGDDNDSDDDAGDDTDDTDDGDGSDSDDDADDADDDDDKPSAADVKGLKSALSKERKARKDAEKLLATKTREETRAQRKKGDELTTTKAELEETKGKAEKLATGFQRLRVDAVIERMARKEHFKDADDALRLIDRKDIEVDQDEDDPSEVEVDEDTVKAALKKLIKTKPHLISSGTDDDDPTGSPMTGRRKGRKGEKDYASIYPNL